jgi:peptide/nickel transport system permease protein
MSADARVLEVPAGALGGLRARRPAWATVPVIIGIGTLALWVVAAVTVPLWAPSDPLETTGARLSAPSWAHLLGTDTLGRDVFTRTMYGARQSLPFAGAVVTFSVVIGCTVGALAGFFGGIADAVAMRIADVTMAFPPILLAMLVTAALGPGLRNTAISLIVVWWPIYARLLRAQVLAVKRRSHVEAAEAIGAGRWRILGLHVLPLSMTPVLVNATMDFGQVVILGAGLSFVGLGAAPPTPEWGISINEGAKYFYQWWIATGPGLAILSIVLACSFVGDGLRDRFDVRTRREAP